MKTDKEILNENYESIRDKILNKCTIYPSKESEMIFFDDEIEISENETLCIEGSAEIGGVWHDDGDGYNTPLYPTLYGGWGHLKEFKIKKYDWLSEEYTQIDPIDIHCRLDDDINEYMHFYE